MTGPSLSLERGAVIDSRYRIVRELGCGAMGVVYVAQHVTLGRHVALKVLRRELATDPELTARFEQEARAASAIGHPHIIDVFDLGRGSDGSPYMVMELLDGMALGDLVAVEGPLPWRRVVEIGAQILGALDAAHGCGIVHRDLKPDNVFLAEREDGPPRAKLLDFGISKVMSNLALEPLLRGTSHGTVMGTPEYMSPEQARGQTDAIDHRTDVYAAGVVLYEMLCGRPPFQGENYNAVLAAILERTFPPLRSLRADVPRALEAVVVRAMEGARERRWQTADEMRAALLACLELPDEGDEVEILDEVIEAAPPPPEAAPRPPPPPPRPSSLVPALFVALLAGGAATGAWTLRRALTPPPPPPAPETIALEVAPTHAHVSLDGVPSVERAVLLAPGTPHTLVARAEGYVPVELRFTAQPGARVTVRLPHALPVLDDKDPPATPAELAAGVAADPLPPWEEIDADLRRADMFHQCLERASERDCQTLRGLTRAMGRPRGPVDEAGDAYVRALAGRPAEAAAAAGALRAALWTHRARADAAELELLADGGMSIDWHARRLLLAARAYLRGGGDEHLGVAMQSADVVRRAADRELAGAAAELAATLRRRKKAIVAHNRLVELTNARPWRSELVYGSAAR